MEWRAWLLFPVSVLSLAAQPAFDALRLERVASGLSSPLFVTHAPGDTDRIFIVERREGSTGRVRILDLVDGTLLAEPFLAVPGVTTAGEQGLLGLAFHPDYAVNGYLYVNYTTNDPAVNPVSPHRVTRVERYTVAGDNPNQADPASAQRILAFPQPFANHNAGWIGFGPDGYLYVATGDGGLSDDPRNAGQQITDDPQTDDADEGFLGAMLRIDVDADGFPDDPDRHYAIPSDNPFVDEAGANPAVWAYGLRNPWRNSFDRVTGDLWIADVGQSAWEEINFQPAGSDGGENYGWRPREGPADNPAVSDPAPEPRTDPFFAYPHPTGFSVTGGYVYRGAAMPWLEGAYFYADFVSAFVRSFRRDGANVTDERDWTDALDESLPSGQSLRSIASFGEDAAGELYLVDIGGEVFRITQSPFNLWRNEHFTTAELEAGTGTAPGDDPDGDGFANDVEFVSGGDPRTADGPWGPRVETVRVEGVAYLELTWELDPNQRGGFALAPESTSDFAGGSWTDEALNVLEDTAERYRVRDVLPIDDEPGRWLRVTVSVE